nr:MAG: major capsid protein [Microviridae sp.]
MAQRILDTGNKALVERPVVNVPSNHFNLSHDVKLSCNIGQLIPCCTMEMLPGDRVDINTEALVRFQPMIAPIMHRLSIRSEWFFVPNRLLWPNWESFISPPIEGVAPPAVPMIQETDWSVTANSLGDYLGLPLGLYDETQKGVSALPFSAYQRVFYDWYRDENFYPLQWQYAGECVDGNNGGNLDELDVIRIRNNDRDYFTSALPWAQKGVVVTIPLLNTPLNISTRDYNFVKSDFSTPSSGQAKFDGLTNVLQDYYGDPLQLEISNQIDVSDANEAAGTIEQLRQAVALQKFLEADARGGTRYVELLWQHFEEYMEDYRAQRCEYIGNTVQPITISEVLNTTGTDSAPQGTMSGHGISVARHANGLFYHAKEHGFLMCIMSVIPVSGYYQGIPKMWSRYDRLDYAWPEFAHLGEQAILNKELFYDVASTNPVTGNEGVWGYVPRYSEYRIQQNRVSGDFRTNLDYWHLARKFASLPALAKEFLQISQGADMDRIFAVIDPTVQHILAHWFHQLKFSRKLPKLVVPSI